MKTSDLVRGWLSKAESDIKTAGIILANPDRKDLPTDMVCFHCQQAVEKFLKAYLVSHHIQFPNTHILKDLVKKAMAVDSEFEVILEKAERLSPYAVDIRYPDDFYLPTFEEAIEAYSTAQEVKVLVTKKIGDGSAL